MAEQQEQLATTKDYKNKLIWVAKYTNNIIYTQYDNGIERSSESIDRSILSSFALHDLSGNKFIEQHFKPGQLFMYRCRTILKTGHNIVERIHIIVCQDGDKRHVVAVCESDFHVEIGDFNVDSKFMYEIVPTPADLVKIGV